MVDESLCTKCKIDEVMIRLKDGRNLCAFCAEDWLLEYKPGDGGVEMDL